MSTQLEKELPFLLQAGLVCMSGECAKKQEAKLSAEESRQVLLDLFAKMDEEARPKKEAAVKQFGERFSLPQEAQDLLLAWVTEGTPPLS